MTATTSSRDAVRAKITDVAAQLLRDEGPAAVTTRRVAAEAGVQAPTLYRLFGDKDGLLQAVAEHVMASFVSDKAARVEAATAAAVDPLDDLRASWELQIDFALANPALFRLFIDPERVQRSPAARAGREVLAARVHRLAETGRLRVSEQRAVDLIQAAGSGAMQTLLSTPPARRDPDLAPTLLAAVLGQILTDRPAPAETGPLGATVAFRAVAPQLEGLSPEERQLLCQWLDRAIDAGQPDPAGVVASDGRNAGT